MGASLVNSAIILPALAIADPNYLFTEKIDQSVINTIKKLQASIRKKYDNKVPVELKPLLEQNAADLYLNSSFHKRNPKLVVHEDESISIDSKGNLVLHQRIDPKRTDKHYPQIIISSAQTPVTEPKTQDSFSAAHVTLDPGHGSLKGKQGDADFDVGLVTFHTVNDKDGKPRKQRFEEEEIVERITLDHFLPQIQKGYHAKTTRNGNLGLETLDQRIRRINDGLAQIKENNPEIPTTVISVHANWSPSAKTKGMILFLSPDDFNNKKSPSLLLAKDIAEKMRQEAGIETTIKQDIDAGRGPFAICRNVKADAKILMEVGFMTNYQDLRVMTEEANQTKLAKALKLGLDAYYAKTPKEVAP